MLIEIHMIQNHSPANLNRDDLGAPKTCYFGGVMRLRISSQCIKRSIRRSELFRELCGGVRTRQLARLIADRLPGDRDAAAKVIKVLEKCGIKSKDAGRTDMLVYTTHAALDEMAQALKDSRRIDECVERFKEILSQRVAAADMALAGRMLETGEIPNTSVEAALQVAHAISTHQAQPEIDYYVAADDIPGTDAGAGYVDEAMFASACFYKYFCIHWETLTKNLSVHPQCDQLAAHTVGAFLRAAALVNPTGKQNSFAAHNLPEGILVEMKKEGVPTSYANAFARPVPLAGQRDIIAQSVAQLGQYLHDLDVGYGKPQTRFWFSPNLRHQLTYVEQQQEYPLIASNNDRQFRSLDELLSAVIAQLGFQWADVQKVKVAAS